MVKSLDPHRLNIVGESHPESGPRRQEEKAYIQSLGMQNAQYWKEDQFQYSQTSGGFKLFGKSFLTKTTEQFGDSVMLRLEMRLADVKEKFIPLAEQFAAGNNPPALGVAGYPLEQAWNSFVESAFKTESKQLLLTMHELLAIDDKQSIDQLQSLHQHIEQLSHKYQTPGALNAQDVQTQAKALLQDWAVAEKLFCRDVKADKALDSSASLNKQRSAAMAASAQAAGHSVGVWKVGQSHIDDIKNAPGFDERALNYNILTKDEFNQGLALWAQQQQP
ncbi:MULTISPECIES: hypothetical protein [Chromobacterium]|uniref:hypothetical protein n=1 Tax=Chromobacterium TaxID=535 RepID=UPI001131E892|nr:hypothetical protein [Chromobacterium haemolyticum]